MRASSEYPCGCHIELWPAGNVIRMCPTHGAAERLVGALAALVSDGVYESDHGSCPMCGLTFADVLAARALLIEIGR
jgi:hypothetical protein